MQPSSIYFVKKTATVILGTVLCIFTLFILFRVLTYSTHAEAASITHYPDFCLGGWKYPQYASGPLSVPEGSDKDGFTIDNSAYLESSVAAHVFCGYFSVNDAKNPPRKAVVHFNWTMDFGEDSPVESKKPESYTSQEGYISVPAVDMVVPVESKQLDSEHTNDVPVEEDVIDVVPTDSESHDEKTTVEIPDTQALEPVSQLEESVPPPHDTVVPEVVPETSTEPEAPQAFNRLDGFLKQINLFVIQRAHAQTSSTLKDFLEVSYSFDGIRWVTVGRVNKDNWKDFQVEVPVTSWDEIKRLQIMVSVLPMLDEKPDIYMDGMSMRAEYDRTVLELTAQSLAAVTHAVDTLVGIPTESVDANSVTPLLPRVVEIKSRKLSFSVTGDPEPLLEERRSKVTEVVKNEDTGSLTFKGSCSRKYFVVLTYRNSTDYLNKISSSLINRAYECNDGLFVYDMSLLPPETTRDGSQYLLIAEQDEIGPWEPISALYPIMIEATTTTETVYQ